MTKIQGGPGISHAEASSTYAPKAPPLPRYRNALAKVRSGTGNAKILCVGDSTTAGNGGSAGGTVPANTAYPARLAARLAATFHAPVAHGLAIAPPNSVLGIPDTRWTLGAAWGRAGYAWCSQGTLTNGSDTVDTLTFTSGVLADKYDLYYLQYGGGSALTATATGGAAVPISCNGAAAVKKITLTAAAASTANTVVIRSTAGGIFILGCEPYLSTTSQVLVGNAGVSGGTVGSWTGSPSSGLDSFAAIAGYAPDLTVLSLGINDAGNSVAAATFSDALATIVTTAKLSGDVILMTMPPSNGAPWTTYEPQYVTAVADLATSLGVGYVDIFTRWGSTWAAANASAYMSDDWHPNDLGYTDMARAVADALAPL